MTLETQLAEVLKKLKTSIASIVEAKNQVAQDKTSIDTTSQTIASRADEIKGYVDTLNASLNTLNTLQQQVDEAKSSVNSVTERAEKILKETTALRDSLTNALNWKGSVDAYVDLPTSAQHVGDTYNVTAADTIHGINAGDNVVWDGEKWDSMGGIMNVDSLAQLGKDANFKEVTATTFHGSLNGKADSASSADVAKTVAWENIGGRPATFPMTPHNHDDRYPLKDGTGAAGTWSITAANATKAVNDSNGQNIATTYAKLNSNAAFNSVTASNMTATSTVTANGKVNINGADTQYCIPLTVQSPDLSAGNGIYINLGKEGVLNNRVSLGYQYVNNGSTDNNFNYSFYGNSNVYRFYASGASVFPGNVMAPSFTGALKGNADTATSAAKDGNGNIIVDTYATKADNTKAINEAKAYTDQVKSSMSGGAMIAKRAEQDAAGNVIVDTYATKKQVDAIPIFATAIVTELPTSNISTSTIYFVKTSDETNNLYTKYIYINNAWEKLGAQTIDLSAYLKAVDAAVTYQKKLDFDTDPTASSTNPVTSGGIYTALSKKLNQDTFDTFTSGITEAAIKDLYKVDMVNADTKSY